MSSGSISATKSWTATNALVAIDAEYGPKVWRNFVDSTDVIFEVSLNVSNKNAAASITAS